MLITLIRHSQTKIEKDIHGTLWKLTDEGISLAKDFAQKPEIRDLDLIYASSQIKAIHTAVLLAEDNYISVKINPDLTELTSITNGFIEDFEGELARLHLGKVERINNGESLEEGKLRINKAIEKIITHESDKSNIGIVAHGNILSIFASQFIDKSVRDIHEIIAMPDVAVLDWDKKEFIKFFSDNL